MRVIRGANHRSRYSPAQGYRYDGLYNVVKYWKKRGKSGFDVWLFRLEKIEETTVTVQSEVKEELPLYSKASRAETTHFRIVRDVNLANKIKELYNFQCQVCNVALTTNAGLYAEAAHIRPLGEPHNGPDTLDNLLCLCPNHHTMFDFGGFAIDDDFSLLGISGKLTVTSGHSISIEFINYQREHFTDL